MSKEEIKLRKKSFIKEYLLPKVGLLTIGFPKNLFGSIDVTNKCNLRCAHCYFFEQGHKVEFTLEQWEERFKEFSKQLLSFKVCTWVGGEPLLRPEIIELGKKYFKFNVVVTNGLIPLPKWYDVLFHVSIDGTEEYYEKMRNVKGAYKKLKENIANTDLDVSAAFCITKLNYTCIEDVLEEWKDTKLKGFIFNFYTPIKGIKDDLWIEWELRDQILDKLVKLKEKYGDFIIDDETRITHLMKSANVPKVVKNCVFREKGFAFDPQGNIKKPCMLGHKADCSKCGCVVPFLLYCRSEKRFIINEMKNDFVNWWNKKKN